MIEKEHRYFRVTGGVVREAYDKWSDRRAAQVKARLDFEAEFGATGTYGNRSMVAGLVYEGDSIPPEGWQRLRGAPHDVYGPPKGKPGAPTRKRMRNMQLVDASDFHAAICGGIGFYGGAGQQGGLRFRFALFDFITDDIFILLIPAGSNCKEGEKWMPPDEYCNEMKASEYWSLKERRKQP